MSCRFPRPAHRFLPLVLLTLALIPRALHAAPPPAPSALPPAELIVLGAAADAADKDALPPTAAFELRFPGAMVAADQVGREASESPLVFAPALKGSFRWTSQRGGVFTVSEQPPMGMAYHASLCPKLNQADGWPLGGATDFKRTFRTPGLEVLNVVAPSGDSKDLDATPKVELLFNSTVDPARAARSFSFQNAVHQRVAATVTAPDTHSVPFGTDGFRQTWRERFLAAHAPADAKSTPTPAPATLVANQLTVRPAAPLTPGKGWKLVVTTDLAGDEPGARLAALYERSLGDVQPFTVTQLTAQNDGEGDRRLLVTFSKPLSDEVTKETAGHWVHVSPEPANLAFDMSDNSVVVIKGDFALDQAYAVTVDAGIPALQAFKLTGASVQATQFTRQKPQLAFADFSVHQLSTGRRQFDLFALNAPEVHLRVKLVPPDAAPLATVEYQKQYYSAEEGGHTEKNRLNFDKAPGKVVYDAKLKGTKDVDKPETLTLKWDDLIGAHRNGFLLIEAEQPAPAKGQKLRAGVQALVQVTDLGVAWKTAPGGELLAYVFSLTDAAPSAKATVRCYDGAGKPLSGNGAPGTLVTDANGIARLPAGANDAAYVEVVAGDDCHVIPFKRGDRSNLSIYGFHLPGTAYQSEDEAENVADAQDADAAVPEGSAAAVIKKTPPPRRDVLIFSDRGVYKPGETAQVKAIVREWHEGGFTNVSPGTPATLRAYDARGRRFFQKEGKLSAAGAINEAIPLPKTSLGHYRVQIVFESNPADDESAESNAESDNGEGDDDAESDVSLATVCRFQVQEYQPNAFQVALAKPAVPVIGGGETPLALAAHYYMGKALSMAKVAWSLKAADTTFEPDGLDEYLFGTANLDYRLRREPGELALDGQGALSDKGELTLAPHIVLNPASPAPRRVHVQASVTDQDQQTVTSNVAYTVHSSDFYLGMRVMPDVVRAGDPLPLEVVAVNAVGGQPRAEPVHVTAKLSHIDWHTQRVANDSGESDYDSKPHLEPVGSVELTTTGLRRLGSQWEPADDSDPAAGNLIPKEPGEYLLELTAKDAAGHEVVTATTVDVLGDKEAEWGYRNAWQVQLVPDKAEYHPGDKATVLVKTPISGRALVSVEREGVSRVFVTELKKEHPALEIPVLAGDAPNVFVSVLLLRGSGQSTRRIKQPEYRAGYCQLNVPKTDSKLAVEVRPAKPEYQPGDEVSVQVSVTDEAHRPAAGAEVTLYAVDKGVLSLTGYQLPNPLKAFYHARPLDVRTGLTLPALLSEDPDDMKFTGDKGFAANKGYLIGGGGEDGRSDRLRQNFVACAYWNATLVTDAQGRVSVTFPAPDNLTEFQVMAVVHEGGGDRAAAGRFGSGQAAFRINKPLMLEPALPRFGNVGDHLILRAVVHNQSPVAGEAEVSVELDDKATMDNSNGSGDDTARVRRVRLAAGESQAVEFPVEFKQTGTAKWTWRARLAGDTPTAQTWRDSVQTTLHVDHPTPRRSEVTHARVTGNASDLLARVNPALLEGEDGLIQVSVSTSRLSELHEGIDSLLHYPYGCVEQTTSSMLPWLVFKDFGDALPEMNRTPQEVEDAVAHGVNRLIGMQTESGGLAYWPAVTGRDPHPWGSAYGALGLALARQAGYFVPQSNLDKLCEYLSKQLRSEEEGDAKATHDTYHDHNETDRCLALYALALLDKGEPAYCETLFKQRDKLSPEDRTLLALAIIKGKGDDTMVKALLQPAPRDGEQPDRWNPFVNAAALDGMRLLAWCLAAPRDPSIENRLNHLLDERTSYGGWGTTQGNAWALLSMAVYASEVEKSAGPASGSVAIAGSSKPFQLGAKQRTFTCEFPLAQLAAGKEKLTLSTPDGKRPLYVQAKVESRPRGGAGVNATATTGQGGYIIRRRYQKVLDNGTLADAAAGKLKVGDRVLVSLDIDAPNAATYVAINDPLPAVLEAINPDFKTAGAGGNAPTDGLTSWVSNYQELREDRAVFFCDALPSGRFHLQYLARVRAAGTTTAPAAKIEEMYHPDRYAETAAGALTAARLE